jgi:trans-AT polyketide synthase, acyltransferase and oxidoreductase domains
MSNSIVFMFSGQGSQYYHMGQELFAQQPIFKNWMLKLNDIVYAITGESVLNKMYDGQKRRSEVFSRVLYTYPAVFMVEYALARVLIESGIIPDYVLGTSMGEFAAAATAGVMQVEEILQALLEQAKLFEASCPSGGMLAVLHDPSLYYEAPVIHQNSELASINYHCHFVISGKTEKLKEIEGFLRGKEIISQLLPVSYAFHSSLIDPVETAYKSYLNGLTYHPSQTSLVSCVSGQITEKLPNDYFWSICRKPIEFPKAIGELEKRNNHIYLDLGPSGTLDNFTKQNLARDSRSKSYSIITPFKLELKNLAKIAEVLSVQTSQGRSEKYRTYVS